MLHAWVSMPPGPPAWLASFPLRYLARALCESFICSVQDITSNEVFFKARVIRALQGDFVGNVV